LRVEGSLVDIALAAFIKNLCSSGFIRV
jgi:hypothetical protein